jgi:cell pole-organizing protein PopZ
MSVPDQAIHDILASIRQAVSIDEVDDEPAAEAPVVPAAVPASDVTLEALVRSALEPLLKAWLDAHLPEIVERAAQAEITRLTRS